MLGKHGGTVDSDPRTSPAGAPRSAVVRLGQRIRDCAMEHARPLPSEALIDFLQPLDQVPHLPAGIRPTGSRAEMRAAAKRPAFVHDAFSEWIEARAAPRVPGVNRGQRTPARCPESRGHHESLAFREHGSAPRELELTAFSPPHTVPLDGPAGQFGIDFARRANGRRAVFFPAMRHGPTESRGMPFCKPPSGVRWSYFSGPAPGILIANSTGSARCCAGRCPISGRFSGTKICCPSWSSHTPPSRIDFTITRIRVVP